MVDESEIPERIAFVKRRIEAACERAERRPKEVRLIGASKLIPGSRLKVAAAAGLNEFGENYVQELGEKRLEMPGAVWHFIGRLQRNKARRVLELADVVHSLEPGRAAERLGRLAAEARREMPVLIQVDFAGHRTGTAPEDVESFAVRVSSWPGVRVEGLMTIPPLGAEPRPFFRRLRELRDGLRERLPTVRELSMGMSADYEEAVEEGATMVRVGSIVFGRRP